MKVLWPLYLLTVFIFSACMPSTNESKANCGTNQKYDKLTRKCFSTIEARYVPTPTLSTLNLSQEIAQEVNLSYQDDNNDKATACKISSVSTNIYAISPLIAERTIYNDVYDALTAGTNVKSSLNNYYTQNPTAPLLNDINNITALLNTMTQEYTRASESFYTGTIESQLALFYTQGTSLRDIAQNYASDSNINYFTNIISTKLVSLNQKLQALGQYCFCAAGTCRTYIVPKISQNGPFSFSYTVSDADGESLSKTVSGNISLMDASSKFITPIASSVLVNDFESSSSVAKSYPFTLGAAKDLFSTTSFSYSFNKNIKTGIIPQYSSTPVTYVESDKLFGVVTGCLGLGGSSVQSLNCQYVPNSGDAYSSSLSQKSSLVLSDLNFTSKVEGVFGNSLGVRILNLKNDLTSLDTYATSVQKFGLVTNAQEVFVRVDGYTLYIYIHDGVTTTLDVKSAILAHPVANHLFDVSGGSSTLMDSSLTPTTSFLTGGLSGYDSISYFVSNGRSTSSVSSEASFYLASVIDVPYISSLAKLSNTSTEVIYERSLSRSNVGSSEIIDLSFTAVDGVLNGSLGCEVVDTSLGAQLSDSPPTCSCSSAAGTCSATLYPKENANGAHTFNYRICSSGGCSSAPLNPATPTIGAIYTLNITSVNDRPSLQTLAPTITILENSTASPQSYTTTLTSNVGGGSFEGSQSLSFVVTSSNPTVLPTSSILLTRVGSTSDYTLTMTPVMNQSAANIAVGIKVIDNGGTNHCTTLFGTDQCHEASYSTSVTITPTNDPPFFNATKAGTQITKVSSNEGGMLVVGPFNIDEDEANSIDEDVDGLNLSIISDNQSIVQNSGISFFYDINDNGLEDAGESRSNGDVLEALATSDSSLHHLYLKIAPVGGASGSANIIMTATDSTNIGPAKSKTYQFSFVVNPVAAIHGGWVNISSIGPKLDKFESPANLNDIQCNYNKSTDLNSCGGGDCVGSVAPMGTVLAGSENLLYKDTATNRCYYSYASLINGQTQYLWKEIKTLCPITRLNGGDNFISITAPTPTKVQQYYFNPLTNKCYQSYQNGSSIAWNTIFPYHPSKVTIEWKAFSLSGSGLDLLTSIKGYNVYRREAGFNYDFKNGFLKNQTTDTMTINGNSTLSFTDHTAQAGKVYYYIVRPVDSNHSLPTYTPEVFSEIRVVAAPVNSSFVHRWMINQEICHKMHMTTTSSKKVDPTKNYRCPYVGPGGSGGYYDYGRDLIVDRFEASCPYTNSPTAGRCINGSNGCIGLGDPTTVNLTSVVDKDIYYDRENGSCYIYDGAISSWRNFDLAPVSLISNAIDNQYDPYNSALNAPMTNLSNAQADLICQARPRPQLYKNATTTMTLFPTITVAPFTSVMGLPEKKDFMAYSAHAKYYEQNFSTESEATVLEKGEALNAVSACNSSNASGLENYFSDSDLPSSSYIFTLAGTKNSGIRSLLTGSIGSGIFAGTENCSSRYGIQDIYGNVAEWVKDAMTCTDATTKICRMSGGLASQYNFGNGHSYAFDMITGPYLEDGTGLGGDSVGDNFIGTLTYARAEANANKFSFPVGLPIYTNIAFSLSCPYTNFSNGTCSNGQLGCIGVGDPSEVTFSQAPANGDVYLDHTNGTCYAYNGSIWNSQNYSAPSSAGLSSILDIGNTAGITEGQLHDDGMIINGDQVNADATQTGHFALGGSYLNGTLSGRYTMELIPDSKKRSDVGFRCIAPIQNTDYDLTDPFHLYSY